MSAGESAGRADVGAALEKAGYEIGERTLAGSRATVASTPYALVACIESAEWTGLAERVAEIQAELTQLAEEAPSARRWDLYLVVLLATAPADAEQRACVEEIESDTRYARKFVHAGVPTDELDRALRPLLPLRPPIGFEIADPFDELRGELLALQIEEATVERAIGSFESEEEVEVA